MEVTASVVALLQGAGLAVSYGKRLISIIQAYKDAKTGLKELILRVEGVWLKTEIQLNVILDLSSSSNHRLLSFQEECLDALETKLHNILRQLENYLGADLSDGINPHNANNNLKKPTKAKYAFLRKRLQGLLADLEAWHSIFDPSWYLLTRLVNGEVDGVLENTAGEKSKQQTITTVQEIRALIRSSTQESSHPKLPLLPSGYLSSDFAIAYGSALRITSVARSGQTVVLDSTAYQKNADPNTVLNTVREMTRLLSISDPFSLGFLKCLGVMRLSDRQFQYVLELPRQGSPQVLRALLLQASPSLDAKLQIAKSLARAVASLHMANFVHKNIRPETVVMMAGDLGEMSEPYLVGFEQLRPQSGHSGLFADMVWYRNIYRHPSRQGLRPQEYYNMQHDIYSLGVCLLEIGIWTSFVLPSADEPQPSPSFNISSELDLKNKTQAALQIKQKLVDKAKAELPSRMGRTYRDVVLSCLTCLDTGASNMFEDEEDLYDEDGIVIGVAFIEKILVRLEGIGL